MFNSSQTYRAISLIIANGLLFSLAIAQNEEKAVLDNTEKAVVGKKNQKTDKEKNQKSQTNNQEERQDQTTEQEDAREVVRPPIHINGENTYTSVSASDAVFLCETSTGKKAFVDRIKRKDYENCTQISGQPEEDTRAEIAQDTSVPPHLYSGEEYNMMTSENQPSIEKNDTVATENTENNNNKEDKPLLTKITDQFQQKKTTPSAENNSTVVSCSGALIYKGSTYIFNEKEPCPIPEEVFKKRKPIEADPSYYTN
ncbi:MAG: hypothetical protein IJ566_06195 [Cardiobacteriaceae bacterium]|nr:hypothetical protein [Cardiobacteriaceae bacterium]